MNIEVANRLVNLRKKNGLSQEELAAKLGISRQAVSKWERAESSPDTDNLICLAKLYNVSLDELLNTDETIEELSFNKQEERVENSKKKTRVDISPTSIHVEDDKDIVHINTKGIHIKELIGDEIHIGSKFYDFDGTITNDKYNKLKKNVSRWHNITGALTLLIVIIYMIFGLTLNMWHPLWYLFILVPVIDSLGVAIYYKNFHKFAFPVLCAFIFCVLGAHFNLWYIAWIVFMFIPVYYLLLPKGKYKIFYKNEDGKCYKEFGIPEDGDITTEDEDFD